MNRNKQATPDIDTNQPMCIAKQTENQKIVFSFKISKDNSDSQRKCFKSAVMCTSIPTAVCQAMYGQQKKFIDFVHLQQQ